MLLFLILLRLELKLWLPPLLLWIERKDGAGNEIERDVGVVFLG